MLVSFLIVIGIVSTLLFIVSLIAIPFLVPKIPVDYFDEPIVDWRGETTWKTHLISIGKNCLGGLVLLAGIIMLATPGQGILTILLGLMLIDFPNKRHWERRIASQPQVLKSLNWLREKRGAPPLNL